MSRSLPQLLIALLLLCLANQKGLATTLPTDTPTEAALARYRQIDTRGGWAPIPAGQSLRLGTRSERVFALRHRLQATGDLPPRGQLSQVGSETTDFDIDMTFDRDMDRAVRRIQRRHGLHVDGIVGPKTLAALNVTVRDRIRQLQRDFEHGHLPEDLGNRYIVVNIPDFTLRIIDQDREVWSTRVVVGKRKRRTPMLRATIDHLVLNPYWHVPSRIARQELLPRAVANPSYLAEQQMDIVAPGGQVVDPSGIDWTAINPRDFPYRIRQRPGARNALGRVKFMFPNPYSVYLHDTPSRNLFARAERAFSHGCVRVENPLELATYLLREPGRERWTPERVARTVHRGEQTYVKLPQPIDVHFVYRTAWVDDDGTVQFRPDIYRHDALTSEKSEVLFNTFAKRDVRQGG